MTPDQAVAALVLTGHAIELAVVEAGKDILAGLSVLAVVIALSFFRRLVLDGSDLIRALRRAARDKHANEIQKAYLRGVVDGRAKR